MAWGIFQAISAALVRVLPVQAEQRDSRAEHAALADAAVVDDLAHLRLLPSPAVLAHFVRLAVRLAGWLHWVSVRPTQRVEQIWDY